MVASEQTVSHRSEDCDLLLEWGLREAIFGFNGPGFGVWDDLNGGMTGGPGVNVTDLRSSSRTGHSGWNWDALKTVRRMVSLPAESMKTRGDLKLNATTTSYIYLFHPAGLVGALHS